MPTLIDRRLPRTEFRAPLSMTTARTSDAFEAETANISERGLFVETDRSLEVGERLRVYLDAGSRTLDFEGYVAWTRKRSRDGNQAGVGIEFANLSEQDIDSLKHFIGTELEHRVQVQLDGLPTPVVARANVRGQLLSLHTELPFLRIGSVANFALEGDATSHRGKIRRVSIEPGGGDTVPRLRIDLAVLGAGATTQAVESCADHADHALSARPSVPLTAARIVPEAAPQWVEPSFDHSTERIRFSRPTKRWAVISATALTSILGAAFAYMALSTSTTQLSYPLPGSSLQRLPIATGPVPSMAAVTALDAEPDTSITTDGANRPADTGDLGAAAAGKRAGGEDAPAPTKERPVPTQAARTAPRAVIDSASPPPIDVAHSDSTTTVRLAVAGGQPTSLKHYLLAEPAGVAVNLPGATLAATARIHETHTGLAKRIWVRRIDGGSQFRVFFPSSANPTYSVATDGDSVVITLRSPDAGDTGLTE